MSAPQTEQTSTEQEDERPEVRDAIVVGSGPSGYTAAIYLARAALLPLVFEGSVTAGGALMNTTDVENYPGFPDGVMGPELMDDLRKQAERFGAELVTDDVTEMDLSADPKVVKVGQSTYYAKTVVLAMGSAYRNLGVPGEAELSGRGVSWCATCDGFFFRDQDIVVVGGGDTAVEEATFLTRFARSVTMVHRRDALRASKVMQQRAFSNDKIRFEWDSEVLEAVATDDRLSGVRLRNLKTGEVTLLAATGLLRGLQDTRTPLVIVGIGFGANALLNAAFIYGFGWGIAGSALGTVLAQWGMAVIFLWRIVVLAQREGARVSPRWVGVATVAASGGWLLLRTVSLRISLLATVVVGSALSVAELGALQIGLALFSLLAFGLDALAIAGQAMIGAAFGAVDRARVVAITRRLILFGVAGGVGLGVVVAALSPVLGLVFTSDTDVTDAVVPVVLLLALGTPLAGFVFVLDGVLIGANDSRYLAVSGILNLAMYLPLLWLAASVWFRGEVRGLGNIPEHGPVLLVGNHSGGNLTPDTFVFTLAFSTYFGVERQFFQLAHNLVLSMPGLGRLRKFGTVAASPENADRALSTGAALLVYPGGDYEVHRPSWLGDRVDFGGRQGWIRLALAHDVPIVPVVSIGGQETALFLSRGEGLAKLLRLDKAFRLKVLPISLGVPWGLNVGDFAGHLPLPAKITVEALPAIHLREEFGPDPDLGEIYDHVTRIMQDTLDALAAERRFWVIG